MGVGGPEPCCRRGKGFDVTLMNLRCVSQREKGSLHHGSSPSVLGLQPHNLVIAGGEVSAVKLCHVSVYVQWRRRKTLVCRDDDDDGFKFETSARSFLLFWHQCQSVNFFWFFFRKSKLHVCQIFTQSAVARSHSGVCASSTCTYKIHELSL